MITLSITFTTIAFFLGIYAAFLWWKSSKVDIIPLYQECGRIEPVEQVDSQSDWLSGMMAAYDKTAKLNKAAAFWTAWTVACATIASISSTLASCGV